jgi:hypothetical protein
LALNVDENGSAHRLTSFQWDGSSAHYFLGPRLEWLGFLALRDFFLQKTKMSTRTVNINKHDRVLNVVGNTSLWIQSNFLFSKSMQLGVFVDSDRLGSVRLEHFRGRLGSAQIFSILTRLRSWLSSARNFWTMARLGSAHPTRTAARLVSARLGFENPLLT